MKIYRIPDGVGGRIREERVRLSLTQAELADQTSSNRRSIIKYEADEVPVDLHWLRAFAEIGANLDRVIFGKERSASIRHTEDELEAMFVRALEWAEEFCVDAKGKPLGAKSRHEAAAAAFRLMLKSKGFGTANDQGALASLAARKAR